VRIAFGANPAYGHVLPLLPLALAARDAGHDVCVIGGASIGPVLNAHGIRHVDAGPPDLAAVFAEIEAGALAGPRLSVRVWSRGFAEVVARPLAHALVDLASDWRPDLVVHEDSEQGTWIGAERLGIPHIALQATAWRGPMRRLSAEPAARIREELGLPAQPALEAWNRYGFLTTRPPALRDPADPMPEGTLELRPVAVDDDGSSAAPWLDRPPAGDVRIAVTLGTVAPERRVPLITTVLDALGPLEAEIVVALGPGLDPNRFLPRPDNVRLVSFVPMSRLLPSSDLVVCHAGSGTVLAALAVGRPMVLLPMAADQPANAAACSAAGVAVVLEPDQWAPGMIRSAVEGALVDRELSRAAGAVRAEIEAMPPPAALIPVLEQLAGNA
jgi:UDP:flavonoid glycosyltransferase YjiC (YdhE family)